MKSTKRHLPSDRSFEQIRNHYEVERAIATRLKKDNKEEGKIIYRTMYDELFEQFPDHPRIKRRENPKIAVIENKRNFKLIRKFINKYIVFIFPRQLRKIISEYFLRDIIILAVK